MAFDAEPTVNARERFIRVRDLIASLPPERFDYAHAWPTNFDEFERVTNHLPVHHCKSNLCILGWTRVLYAYCGREEAYEGLGLTDDQGHDLFFSGGNFNPNRDQAIRTMDHLLATGVVDWTIGAAA